MAKKTKTLADVQTVTTVNDDQLIPITDASGNVVKVSMANLRAALMMGIDINIICDGVFIVYHRKLDNNIIAVKPYLWLNLQNNGEIADGVMIVEGGHILVIAPTEGEMTWSSANVNGGGIIQAEDVLYDWEGKAHTATQITHTECNTINDAPGFCSLYSRENINGSGLFTGNWWLPSVAELMMIYANFDKINYALSLINGAMLLQRKAYWSSSEVNDKYAFIVNFDNCIIRSYYWIKIIDNNSVRPVSSFIL